MAAFAATSEVPVTMVDQLSRAPFADSMASLAVPTQVPVLNAIRTASTASGSNSERDLAEATAEAAKSPVHNPMILVLARDGNSDG